VFFQQKYSQLQEAISLASKFSSMKFPLGLCKILKKTQNDILPMMCVFKYRIHIFEQNFAEKFIIIKIFTNIFFLEFFNEAWIKYEFLYFWRLKIHI